MVGILLTLLAVLFVLALAFCFSDQSNPFKELHFLHRDRKRKGSGIKSPRRESNSSVPKPR